MIKARLLKLLYGRIIKGMPGVGTPEEVAARFEGKADSLEQAGQKVVHYYTGLGSATGFVFGLPGYLFMPITVPANVIGVAALQLHMTAAVAVLAGRDLNDSSTRDACVECLLKEKDGRGRKNEEEEAATRTGVKLAERGVRFLSERAVSRVGRRRLPILGGVLGASSDAFVTRNIGLCARAEFLSEAPSGDGRPGS